ncbi:MAG: redox-sensing transcriptional repressor Rex [Acidobacteriota bacterium]
MTLDRRSVSESTAARLSLYLRSLEVLEGEGVRHVSSDSFARRFELNSSQIRKDLATFGEFGVRGVGYEVASLRRHLVGLLGLDRTRRIAIVGAGRLGTALADYPGFRSGGFAVAAVFDTDPARIGARTRSGLTISPLDDLPEMAADLAIEVAVLTVPEEAAAAAARLCWDSGISGILNFTPARLAPPSHVRVKNVDLKIQLETLSFYIGAGPIGLSREKEEPWRRTRSRSLPRRT